MKVMRFLGLVPILALIISCSYSNRPPSVPSNPQPPDGSQVYTLSPQLRWESSDPDGDPVVFDLYFGEGSPATLVAHDLKENSYIIRGLEYTKTYRWKVVAKDDQGHVVEGPVWSFTTYPPPEPNEEWFLDTGVKGDYLLRGNLGTDRIGDIMKTSDGGFILTSSFKLDIYRPITYGVAKITGDGSVAWVQKISYHDYTEHGGCAIAEDSIETSDGGYITVGYVYGWLDYVEPPIGGTDIVIIKFDRDGNVKWGKLIGGSDHDYAFSIDKVGDDYIVVGSTKSFDGDFSDRPSDQSWYSILIMRISESGDILYKRYIGISGANGEDMAYRVRRTSDGGYIVVGKVGLGAYIAKFSSDDDLEWDMNYYEWPYDQDLVDLKAEDVIETDDGGYLIVGCRGSGLPTRDGFILRLNEYHEKVWVKKTDWWIHAVTKNAFGNYVLIGIKDNDVYVEEMDDNGNVLWSKSIGYPDPYNLYNTDEGIGIVATDDPGIVIAGYVRPSEGDDFRFFVAKYVYGSESTTENRR